MNIHTDAVYSHAGYDVIIDFLSEVKSPKAVEITAYHGFGWNFLRRV